MIFIKVSRGPCFSCVHVGSYLASVSMYPHTQNSFLSPCTECRKRTSVQNGIRINPTWKELKNLRADWTERHHKFIHKFYACISTTRWCGMRIVWELYEKCVQLMLASHQPTSGFQLPASSSQLGEKPLTSMRIVWEMYENCMRNASNRCSPTTNQYAPAKKKPAGRAPRLQSTMAQGPGGHRTYGWACPLV